MDILCISIVFFFRIPKNISGKKVTMLKDILDFVSPYFDVLKKSADFYSSSLANENKAIFHVMNKRTK